MKLYKKILIAVVVILFTYILFNLLNKRRVIQTTGKSNVEAFTFFGGPDTELAALKNTSQMNISNVNPKYTNKPLREYVIKSSYNTAVTGKYVNPDMIKYVLQRGCRFLDFEVFYINDRPEVAFSTDSNFQTIDSENSLLLDNVFSTIVSNAFIGPSPNTGDPVFIHLRIKSNNPAIYKKIATSIDFALRAKLYSKPVTNDTLLSEVMGKIVVIMDKTIDRDYRDFAACEPDEKDCLNLVNFINVESGSETLQLNRYSEILNQCTAPPTTLDNCELCTDVKKMRVVVPDLNYENTANPEISEFILSYGCQIVPYRFYTNDTALADYEDLFNNNNSAFVPLASAIYYFRN